MPATRITARARSSRRSPEVSGRSAPRERHSRAHDSRFSWHAPSVGLSPNGRRSISVRRSQSSSADQKTARVQSPASTRPTGRRPARLESFPAALVSTGRIRLRASKGLFSSHPQRTAQRNTCLTTLTRLATVGAASLLSAVVRLFFRRALPCLSLATQTRHASAPSRCDCWGVSSASRRAIAGQC